MQWHRASGAAVCTSYCCPALLPGQQELWTTCTRGVSSCLPRHLGRAKTTPWTSQSGQSKPNPWIGNLIPLKLGQSGVEKHIHLQPGAPLSIHAAHLLFSYDSAVSDDKIGSSFTSNHLMSLAILGLLLLPFSFRLCLTPLCSLPLLG